MPQTQFLAPGFISPSPRARPLARAPLVLLHGILDSHEAWRRVAERLEARGRVVLLHASRGHPGGEAWRAGMDWSPRAEAADVAALLRGQAPGGAHLVGHSRGGTAAAWVALEAADLVRSLTLVATPPQASEAFRAHFRALLAEAKDDRAREALRFLSAIPDEEFPAEAMRRAHVPALVVEASRDALYSPTATLFWRMFLPYADFERIDAGHRFFVEEAAADWLAERILAFVERVEAGDARA